MRRAALLLLLLLSGCALPVRDGGEEAGLSARIAPLLAFFQALDRGAGPVAVLQAGDSHTANDAFSGRMRELFQQRFGDAGRGMLPPGIPFKFYRPQQVSVTASGWTTLGSLRNATPGPFGLAGVRQTAAKRAEMTIAGDFEEVVIEALGQPGGGTIEAHGDQGAVRTLRTDGSGALFLAVPGRSVTLRALGDGPVTVLSWTAAKRRGGVTWSNLGTIGATIDTFARFDPGLVRSELERLRPALILVAFGTNEGFDDSIDPVAYRARYAARLRGLHQAAPYASIIVIGAPDGNRRGRASACPDTAWGVPPNLAPLREAQRQVAREGGYYFWDWSAAMGGACSMHAWTQTEPAMAAADHVHLLTPGYRATADKLFSELMRLYERHRRDLPGS
jgi:hypothetical protein